MAEPLETVEIENRAAPGQYLVINRADLRPTDRLRGAAPAPAPAPPRPAKLPAVTTPDDSDPDRKRGKHKG